MAAAAAADIGAVQPVAISKTIPWEAAAADPGIIILI